MASSRNEPLERSRRDVAESVDHVGQLVDLAADRQSVSSAIVWRAARLMMRCVSTSGSVSQDLEHADRRR